MLDTESSGFSVPSQTNGHADTTSHTLQDVCKQVHTKIYAFLALDLSDDRLRSTQEHTRISLGVMKRALDEYSFDTLALSYNGGKDCLVLLILYLAALHDYFTPLSSSYTTQSIRSQNATTPTDGTTTSESSSTFASSTTNPTTSSSPSNLTSIYTAIPTAYVTSLHPFAEVDSFVEDSVREYHLNVSRFDGAQGMKSSFSQFLDQRPQTKAIFVGTRRTDPHGEKLTHFDMTDHGWPVFMRVHPVIDWGYADIWAFLRALEIPYCILYDRGYTSLGGTSDTHPNPALLDKSASSNHLAATEGTDDQQRVYRPAYELVADEEERLGRNCI